MKVLLFVVFALGLDSTGFSLVCMRCTSTTAACSESLRNCTEEELCISTATRTTAADGQETYTFDRDCGDADQCNATGSITSLLSVQTHSTCCDTDSCTPPQPTLTDGKKLSNDIQCPVCLARNAGQCSPLNVQNCTGDEEYCGVYKLTTETESTILMGCASESFCHTAQSQKLVNGKITKVTARCIRSWSDRLKAQIFHLLPVLLGTLVYII